MKKLLFLMIALLIMTGCGRNQVTEPDKPTEMPSETIDNGEKGNEVKRDMIMQMKINETLVTVQWEDNESVEALKKLLINGDITISMSMYGGFEQVGSLGTSLPRNDVQVITESGDIVLYSGNQIVVFYGSNSWSYTRLGHIADKSPQEMKDLLGNGNVTIVISADWKE